VTNYIQLANGNGYDFDTGEIFGRFSVERDLAQPLAGANRYVRHTDRNWPVAIHSVCVAKCIETLTGNTDAAAAGLLHDCHEAVIGDIPTPVAWHIGYAKVKELKHEVHRAIFERLGLDDDLLPDGVFKEWIDYADQAALHVERQIMMAPEPREWTVPRPGQTWMLTMYDLVTAQLECGGNSYDNAHYTFVQEYERLCIPLMRPSKAVEMYRREMLTAVSAEEAPF
jgi:hypothetical protein